MNRAELRRGMRVATGWRGKKAKRSKVVHPAVQEAFRSAIQQRVENMNRLEGKRTERLWTP